MHSCHAALVTEQKSGKNLLALIWSCAARFGNDSESHLDQLRFELKANGPGPLSHWWEHGEGNTICLAYSAEHAGDSLPHW